MYVTNYDGLIIKNRYNTLIKLRRGETHAPKKEKPVLKTL
jgi:hypothetical protein